jgi:catechol 2,3-dioxygenase-like lactoylglutathione lyase family enzyme
MKTTITIVSLSAVLACLTLLAQESPRPGRGGPAELFKQLDRNGDRKVSREEAGGAAWFDRVDQNQDGAIDSAELEMLRKTMRTGRAAAPAAGMPTAAPRPAPPTRSGGAAKSSSRDFVPDAPFVGQINGSYIDPEFSESASQVVFQDAGNRVWIGDIDPETGLFKTATGCDYMMDENITIIFDRPPQGRKFSTNGPEWTRDEKGHIVVYTKEDSSGIMQQWAARLVDGKSVVTQLTRNKFDCYGNMPSRFQDGKPPRIAYTYDWPIWNAKAAWIFLDQPDAPRELANFDYNQMSMWSAVSPHFLFVQKPKDAPHGQIALSDTETSALRVLTDDGGAKNDPGMFRAPEFGGEILLVCNVDNSALAIYRDEKRDGKSPWRRIATLKLPDDAPYRFISSPETIAPATGVGGVTYFSLLARENKDRRSRGSIWVFGLGTDPNNRFARRVDDGKSSTVLEPEPFVGKTEVYVYYNAYDGGTRQNGVRRAATGIKVAASSPARNPQSAPVAAAAAAAPLSIAEELTKASLEVCLNARDEGAARRFLTEGLGLAERSAPPWLAGGGPRKLLLFTSGNSTIKVRVHGTPPEKLPPEVAARNGFRLLTVPLEGFDEVVPRLKRLGFECGDVQESEGTRWTLARNKDGTAFELVEAQPGAARELEIGLVVPDLAKAREFFTSHYGARELPATTSRALPGLQELRFTTGATVFKCWAPPGERASDAAQIPEVLGFRYVTHNVRDPRRLHEAFSARGVEIAVPMSSYREIADLFFARGPGGVLLEFLAVRQAPAADSEFRAASPPGSPAPSSATVGGTGEAFFKRLDRNGDGKLTEDELGPDWLKRVDADGDGSVTREELQAYFQGRLGAGQRDAVPPADPMPAPPAVQPKPDPLP